jgi:hypothetical protein
MQNFLDSRVKRVSELVVSRFLVISDLKRCDDISFFDPVGSVFFRVIYEPERKIEENCYGKYEEEINPAEVLEHAFLCPMEGLTSA